MSRRSMIKEFIKDTVEWGASWFRKEAPKVEREIPRREVRSADDVIREQRATTRARTAPEAPRQRASAPEAPAAPRAAAAPRVDLKAVSNQELAKLSPSKFKDMESFDRALDSSFDALESKGLVKDLGRRHVDRSPEESLAALRKGQPIDRSEAAALKEHLTARQLAVLNPEHAAGIASALGTRGAGASAGISDLGAAAAKPGLLSRIPGGGKALLAAGGLATTVGAAALAGTGLNTWFKETIYGTSLREGGFEFNDSWGGNSIKGYRVASNFAEGGQNAKGAYDALNWGDEAMLTGYISDPERAEKMLKQAFGAALGPNDFDRTTHKLTEEGTKKALTALSQNIPLNIPTSVPNAPFIIGAVIAAQSGIPTGTGSTQELSGSGLLLAQSQLGLGKSQSQVIDAEAAADAAAARGDLGMVRSGVDTTAIPAATPQRAYIDFLQSASDDDFNLLFDAQSPNSSVIKQFFQASAKGDYQLDGSDATELKAKINGSNLAPEVKQAAERVFGLG